MSQKQRLVLRPVEERLISNEDDVRGKSEGVGPRFKYNSMMVPGIRSMQFRPLVCGSGNKNSLVI